MAETTAAESFASPAPPAEKRLRTYGLIGLVVGGLVALGAMALVAANYFAQSEIERGLREWQKSLGIVAETSASAMADYARRQREEVESLASNETVELFFLEWDLAGGDLEQIPDFEAQSDYLRNLLTVTAERTGFTAPQSAPTIGANIDRAAEAGLFIYDRTRRPIAGSAPDRPPPVAAVPDNSVLVFARGEDDALRLAIQAPIYPLQMPRLPETIAGLVYGVKDVGSVVAHLITPPSLPDFEIEVSLLRATDSAVSYLATSAADKGALATPWALDTPDLAEAFAVQQPDGFATRRDWQGREVLVAARAIPGTDLTVMVTTDRGAAIGAIEERYTRFQVVIWMFLGLLAAVIAVIWRHGASVRATALMRQYQAIAAELREQQELLKVVTDSQPNAIFILDGENQYGFANAVVERRLDLTADAILGKRIDAVLGPARAEHYRRLNFDAISQGQVRSGTVAVEAEDGRLQHLHTDHIPLPRNTALEGSVLVVERDITNEILERQRREESLESLIEALVSLVDLRDPNAGNHSRRVGHLAEILGAEMGLTENQVATAKTAGMLMNLGKLLVPEETLQSERQSADERNKVRAGIRATAKLLSNVPFDGPVVETLAQVQEHFDGSGEPQGLQGDAILITARLIAAANATVSMLSPRSYRDALEVDQACSELVKNMNTIYDPGVVGALLNFVQNKGGRAVLEQEIRQATDDGVPDVPALQ